MLIPAFLLHQCVLNDNLYTEPVKEGRNIIGAYRMSSLFLKYWKLLLLVNILFCAIVISFDLKHLHSENALLENLQGFFLISATAVYFRLAVYSTGDARLACIGAGMLCFSFFTRELGRCGDGVCARVCIRAVCVCVCGRCGGGGGPGRGGGGGG